MRNDLLDSLREFVSKLSADGASPELGEELKSIIVSLEDTRDMQELQNKRLRDQLAQAARVAEVGIMAASIFHEMNQPLLGIKGFAELILDHLKRGNTEKIAQWAEDIRTQANRMHEIQRDVTTFLRRRENSGESTSLQTCLDHVLRLFKQRLKKKKIELALGIQDGLPPLNIERDQLGHILVNLIGNGIDAMENQVDGRLSVVTANDEESSRVHILVADNGGGIPSEFKEQIFEPFISSKGQKGTGLGLYIAKELAQANGGSLELRDPASLGWALTPSTVFDLCLVKVSERASAGPEKEETSLSGDPIEPPSAQEILNQKLDLFARQLQVSRRVLVVDDEPVILRVITEYLAQNSILADVVTTAEEALERMSERDYAVVVTDKNLPGMDGIDLLKVIKESKPETEVLIITGFASLDSALDAIRMGAFDYIPKPFPNLTYVTEKIRGALARHDFEVRVKALIGYLSDTCKKMLADLPGGSQSAWVQRLQEVLDSHDADEQGRVVLMGTTALANTARKMDYQVVEVGSLDEVVSLLASQRFHVVVFVEEDAETDGSVAVKLVRQTNPDVGVLVVAREGNLKKVVQAIGVGVGDYLVRPVEGREMFGPRLDRLVVRQQRVVRYRYLLESLKNLNIELQLSSEGT